MKSKLTEYSTQTQRMEPNRIGKVSPGNAHFGPSGGTVCCLTIGFSARALAEAVREAGFRVIAVDAFGDYDTRESAKVPQIIPSWGAMGAEKSLNFSSWVCCCQSGSVGQPAGSRPVFLAGGCETWLDLLNVLHANASLRVLGPTVAEMRALRDPANWKSAVSGTNILFPDSLFTLNSDFAGSLWQETGRKWLLKKSGSSGGLGVRALADNSVHDLPEGHYWQERIEGRSIGASCLVTADESGFDVQFVGATESWKTADWPAPAEFIYRGSFGPIELTGQQQAEICRITHNLISRHSPNLVGWMQLDLIEDSSGRLWLLEVNPRWTAGMEILRLSDSANLAALHAQAHGIRPLQPAESCVIRAPARFVGKAVYYPSADVLLTPETLQRLQLLKGQGFSDIPSLESVGTVVQAGHPLLTISAAVSRESHCEASGRQAVLDELHRKRKSLNCQCSDEFYFQGRLRFQSH
jgi:uncharacterized protein